MTKLNKKSEVKKESDAIKKKRAALVKESNEIINAKGAEFILVYKKDGKMRYVCHGLGRTEIYLEWPYSLEEALEKRYREGREDK